MPWQPARHHLGSLMDKLEMAEAEGDHRESEENPRDTEPDVAGEAAEVMLVPISREPDIQNPGGRHNHCEFAPWVVKLLRGSEQAGQSEGDHPKQERDEEQ